MRLPDSSSHYSARVRYGRYVARRLRRASFDSLAADVTKVNDLVLLRGRALEDTDGPEQDALADRDAADDALDEAAKTARAKLAGRSAAAEREPPYTLIFPNGVGFYTAAPLDEEEPRYTELKKRLAEHLPASDDVRKETSKAIDAGLKDFAGASKALAAARTEGSLAGTRLETAQEAWGRQMDKTYGALVAEVGKARADSYFPAVRTSRRSKASPPPTGP